MTAQAVFYCVNGLSTRMRADLDALARDTASAHGFQLDKALIVPDTRTASLESALAYIEFHDSRCMIIPTLKHLPRRDVAPVLRRCELITLFPLASYIKAPS